MTTTTPIRLSVNLNLSEIRYVYGVLLPFDYGTGSDEERFSPATGVVRTSEMHDLMNAVTTAITPEVSALIASNWNNLSDEVLNQLRLFTFAFTPREFNLLVNIINFDMQESFEDTLDGNNGTPGVFHRIAFLANLTTKLIDNAPRDLVAGVSRLCMK